MEEINLAWGEDKMKLLRERETFFTLNYRYYCPKGGIDK